MSGASEHLWLRDLRRHPRGEVRLYVDGRLVSGTYAGQVIASIDLLAQPTADEAEGDDEREVLAAVLAVEEWPDLTWAHTKRHAAERFSPAGYWTLADALTAPSPTPPRPRARRHRPPAPERGDLGGER